MFSYDETKRFSSNALRVFTFIAPACLLMPAGAHAEDVATLSYNAWNAAFLVKATQPGGEACNGSYVASGDTYYAKTLTSVGLVEECLWVQAQDIALSEDVYERTHSPAQRQLVNQLLLTFITNFGSGSAWTSYDGWNDDIAWMVNALIRGYRITGNEKFLKIAAHNWNLAYDRGWDNTLGGGIWENSDKQSKNALSNDPFIFDAINLYESTGEARYLNKAVAIYTWVRKNLFNTGTINTPSNQPGQVNGSINLDGSLGVSNNVYDSGAFLEAANSLHRVTRDPMYYNDAVLAASFIINQGPILHNSGENFTNQWAYWFVKGLSDFATENNLWPTYHAYLLKNAEQAWSERNSLNLTWNDWSSPTNEPNANSFEMTSAVAIWQFLPPTSPAPFTGNYELRSEASGLSMSVAGASTSQAAAIVQVAFDGTADSLWTITPTSGGYYAIKNVNSGLLANVQAASGKPNAPIVQWPAGDLNPGNDQWWPVKNSDGSYSFFNAYSGMALDVPQGSQTPNLQLDQEPWRDGTTERFLLVAH